MLYTRLNCGLRQVVEIFKIFNETFDGILGNPPCFNTIVNWVKKCGLAVYETAGQSFKNQHYAQIVDESMMIGSEKLLLTLGIPAESQGRPLSFADVSILDMAVAESWNGESVGKQLQKASEKVGHSPSYVISDNASIMKKGVRVAQLNHQFDISHSLGMFLERTYKKASDFEAYVKSMTDAKCRYNMKKVAYLLAPCQRINSRFINLSGWVSWSGKMLSIYHKLSEEEQQVFSFVTANASLIDELSDVVKCIGHIESLCKHKGLSKQTVNECRKEIARYLLCGNSRMIHLGECIAEFLINEATKIVSEIATRNNSSDIVESIFGKYKARKSPNKLNGVTQFIFFIPIHAELSKNQQCNKFNFKAALENKLIRHIDAWAKDNLTVNLTQLRSNCLKKVA